MSLSGSAPIARLSTSEPILVTGATGNVGREVVRELRAVGASVRAATTTPERARLILSENVQVVRFAFGDRDTYAPALRGVRGLFLLRPPEITDVRRLIDPVVDSALQAGVRQVVFLSLQGAERNPFVPHYRIERHLRASGIPYTFLRAGFFLQNLSTTHAVDIRERNELFVPAGAGRTAFVDVRDLAAVAARVLTVPGHDYQACELTGAEALSYPQVATTLSRVLGRHIVYADPSPIRFWQRLRGRRRPVMAVVVMLGVYTACRLGLAAHVTRSVAHLLGREPISFEQFARDAAAAWRPAVIGA